MVTATGLLKKRRANDQSNSRQADRPIPFTGENFKIRLGGAVIGEADRWPCLYANARFSANVGAGGTITKWNFTAARRALYQGGDWMTGATTCRAVYNRGSVGVPRIGIYSLRGGGSFQLNDPALLAAGYNSVDVPIAAGAGDSYCEVTGSGAGDEIGQNLYMMGIRHKVDGATGLTLGCFGIGGAGVADLNSTSLISAAAVTAMVVAFEIDTIIINVGTNDTTWGATQYNQLLGIMHGMQGANLPALADADLALLANPRELAIANKLAEFRDVIENAARDLAPHLIAFYLKDLAGEFHGWYNAERMLVDDAALRDARVALAAAVRQVIRNGLAILGVSCPESM